MMSKSPFKEACLVTKNEVISCHNILCFGTFLHGQGIGEVCPLPIALSILRNRMVIGGAAQIKRRKITVGITHGQAEGGGWGGVPPPYGQTYSRSSIGNW